MSLVKKITTTRTVEKDSDGRLVKEVTVTVEEQFEYAVSVSPITSPYHGII